MEQPRNIEAQHGRKRGKSIDVGLIFNRCSSTEMQSKTSPRESSNDLAEFRNRLRHKSWVTGAIRKSSLQVEKKRSASSKPSFDYRRSSTTRYNGHQFEGHKTGRFVDYTKMNLPKKWLKEYEKKQADLQKKSEEKLQPLDRFRRAVRLILTCNMVLRSIVHHAIEKGHYEKVTSDAALSLKSAAAKGAVENLMFDPELYKCHHEFLMPRWAKEITCKELAERTKQEIHSIVQLMKQLKGFRRYSFKIQEAICAALRYDCFDRRRVIIRKGHVAQRFYFIFSGSVCVTVDDDEHSAFAKPTENAVLKRGDHFGELAFIRGLKRAATVVCLERTELLSVEKEDFFSAKIDLSFNADMQRRVEYIKEHPVFRTWPEEVVKKVAEESRLRDYNSDEVIVRDSCKLHWIIFVAKGQCDVLRLLDLSNCKEYIDHALKYRMEKIQDDAPLSTYIPSVDDISLNSVALRGGPSRLESPEEESTVDGSEKATAARRKAKSEQSIFYRVDRRAVKTADQASKKGILHSENTAGKSAKGRVSFQVEEDQYSSIGQGRLQSSEPKRRPLESNRRISEPTPVCSTIEDHGVVDEKRIEDKVGVGVYMMVDRLRPGQCFGAWSLLEQEDKCLPFVENIRSSNEQNEKELSKVKSTKRQTKKEKKPRERRFTLVSGGCEVIKVAKDVFFKYSDTATLDKLSQLTTTYPEDSILCQTYLQQSDWRTYREEIVDNVVVRHIARLETAKGSSRSHKVRSSPVPSPLCSMKMWPPVNSKWEYFPDTGWVPGYVARPAIEAGTSRPNHAAKLNRSPVTSRSQSPSLRKWSPAQCGTPRGSPIPPPAAASKSSEKLLPLVTNDLVLAQGSQRALVLTQGGSRCNDYQLQIERRIINKHDMKKTNQHFGKVT